MKEELLDELVDLFYNEAPYDWTIEIDSDDPPENVRGICFPTTKVVVLFAPQSYVEAKWAVLHELAHARMNRGHTLYWEQEFVRLLKKYNFPRSEVTFMTNSIGPVMQEWITNG